MSKFAIVKERRVRARDDGPRDGRREGSRSKLINRSMFAIVKEKRVRLRMTDQETEESD